MKKPPLEQIPNSFAVRHSRMALNKAILRGLSVYETGICSSDGDIPTASAKELIESSNTELITQINSRIQQQTYALLIGLASIIIAGGFAFSALIIPSNFIIIELLLLLIAVTVGITGLYLAWGTNQQEKLARITTLQYNLDEETKSAFTKLQKTFNELTKDLSKNNLINSKYNGLA